MNAIKVKTITPWVIMPKDFKRMINRKNISALLKDFRDFVDRNPNYYYPFQGYIKWNNESQYEIFPLIHYYMNKHLLDANTRSIKFKDDLKRVKDMVEQLTLEEVEW